MKQAEKHIEIKTDNFSENDQKEIVRMVLVDYKNDDKQMSDWEQERAKDVQMYESEAPSVIENLEKYEWMSDRNLGLCQSICDTYQATLLSTCYNIDTVHLKATEKNDKDNRDNLAKFVRWGLGPSECDFFAEVDDFIHNRITQGVSYFYIYWEVKYEWIDRRIPKLDKDGNTLGYDIQTELKRFEKGRIENIDDVSDLKFPTFGDTLQKKAHLIHVVHKHGKDIVDLGKRKVFLNVDDTFKNKIKKACYDKLTSEITKEKLTQMGLTDEHGISENDLKNFPVDLYVWYGPYEKDGKVEEYRFIVEPITQTFLSGKPLRKITRTGKRPFVGSGLIRRPGLLQGKSLPRATSHIINQINNIYNQKADFQYISNCPFGFYNPDEAHIEQVQDIAPGKMFPSNDPSSVNFPNLSRSLAWADNDIKTLLEMLERLTGAASYFMNNRSNATGTATRDAIINEKSETRFGLWVKRLIDDISEAITMWMSLYQDNASPELAERILGEDGKQLFKNLSVETLRGGYDVYLSPDIIAGSKTLEKEIALWGYQALTPSIWFNPQINPKGSWNLTVHTAKKVGLEDIEQWMPPEPKAEIGRSERIEEIMTQIKQGDEPKLDPTDNMVEIFAGMQILKNEKYDELDPEYKPLFDQFFFKVYVGMMNFIRQQQQQMIADQMAFNMIREKEMNGEAPQQTQQPNQTPVGALPEDGLNG